MMILAPFAAMLIQLAISRSREYDADAASAKYVGSPYPLIQGLQELEGWSKKIPMRSRRAIFMCCNSPEALGPGRWSCGPGWRNFSGPVRERSSSRLRKSSPEPISSGKHENGSCAKLASRGRELWHRGMAIRRAK